MRVGHGDWELVLRPERGCRITSLRLRGEEMLDQGIGVDQPGAEDFVEGGAFGWDELVPNLEAAGALPDHGEAWRLPWEVLEQSSRSIRARARGRMLPWELERRIEVGETVRLTYVYKNVEGPPHRAFWCAHPLFRYEVGMTIGVPGGGPLGSLAPGTSTKVFLEPGAVDRATLRWPSGTSIELRWDSTSTPYTGIWACNGDLGGYRQVAIEPATAGGHAGDEAPLLEAGATLEWWLEVRESS